MAAARTSSSACSSNSFAAAAASAFAERFLCMTSARTCNNARSSRPLASASAPSALARSAIAPSLDVVHLRSDAGVGAGGGSDRASGFGLLVQNVRSAAAGQVVGDARVCGAQSVGFLLQEVCGRPRARRRLCRGDSCCNCSNFSVDVVHRLQAARLHARRSMSAYSCPYSVARASRSISRCDSGQGTTLRVAERGSFAR